MYHLTSFQIFSLANSVNLLSTGENTKKRGNKNPITLPKGPESAPIVVALALSLSPNQIAASLGGA